MNIAYLDTDAKSSHLFELLCSTFSEIDKTVCCSSVCELLDIINKEEIDLVFSEVSLPDGDAFELSLALSEEPYNKHTVLVTQRQDFAERAFASEMFGYIAKPCTSEKLGRVLSRYRRLVGHESVPSQELYIKTFGRFEVFVGDEVLHFTNKKSKELLALLVDRDGGHVTMEQAVDTLWEDRAFDECTKTLYRIALKNLRDKLAEVGYGDILIEKRGQRCIDKKKVHCDYFDFLDNPEKYAYLFNDEYMIDYSWSEVTLAKIVKLIEKK